MYTRALCDMPMYTLGPLRVYMGILQEEAAGQHERAHHGAPQACMCSPKRILETMGIGAMLGVMRLAVWRLPRTTEAVCSTTVGLRSVPAATFPAARRAGGRTVYCKNHSSAAYQLEASAL